MGFVVPALLACALWVALFLWWQFWRPNRDAEVRFGRAVAAVVAGMLFIAAYRTMLAPSHLECSQGYQTRDGFECDDYGRAAGPDADQVLLLAAMGAGATWVSASSRLWLEDGKSG